MGDFYLFSDNLMLLCVVSLSLTVVAQTMCVTYGFYHLEHRVGSVLQNLVEMTVLIHLLVLALLVASVRYHSLCGFVYPSRWPILRYFIFGVLTLLCITLSWQRSEFSPMVTTVAAALSLPFSERISGSAFPFLFFSALIFWQLRSFYLSAARRREQHRELSTLSIKEAVDNLDSALLFCQLDGQILLQNSKMQELMIVMTGSFQSDGKLFYENLVRGDVLPTCKKGDLGQQLAYWLPDGSIWSFEVTYMEADRMQLALLVASDNTPRWTAAEKLWEQNQELERRNRELTQVLDNLENIIKNEETIRAKSRVHDVLGQRISLLLRAMREHREPDEVLLRSFSEGLPRELTEVTADNVCSLDTLVEVFQGLGVTIQVDGSLPRQENIARAMFEIAAEAVTNAVRHGYASQVSIRLFRQSGSACMLITDSGLPSPGPVSEGEGLRGMRRRTAELGGTFSYSTTPHFKIQIQIPEEHTI